MEDIPYINELDLKGKRVLIRADFNVPLDEKGNISDDTRIRGVLPTINYALDEGAKVILASHLGRPKGKFIPEMGLATVAKRLGRLLGKEVKMAPDCVGDEVKTIINYMGQGEVVLLENLRFHQEEEKNDETFGKQLAELCDVFINDAFATAHRSHASNIAITHHVPECAGGFLMNKEMSYFEKALGNPMRPLVAIIGGAKVSGKIEVLENLIDKVDKLLIGGGMAFTFLKARGYDVGKSLVENDLLDMAGKIIEKAKTKGVKLYMPVDCVAADRFDAAAETKVVAIQEIPPDWMGLDIGPATTMLFSAALEDAKTIVWNGPMGVFEMDAFSRGTYAMVTTVANSYAVTIVGGGDTDVAIHRAGDSAKISYISTGGGAFLELLEGKDLPAISALHKNKVKQREVT
ncbi:MAG: phosphoglycerate kinase [Proteobacteria bacterium]|nr:phosphoglycerate kinase [Pseudomonadota bacterium]